MEGIHVNKLKKGSRFIGFVFLGFGVLLIPFWGPLFDYTLIGSLDAVERLGIFVAVFSLSWVAVVGIYVGYCSIKTAHWALTKALTCLRSS